MDLGRSRNESSVCSDNHLAKGYNLSPMKLQTQKPARELVPSTPRLAQSQIYDTNFTE